MKWCEYQTMRKKQRRSETEDDDGVRVCVVVVVVEMRSTENDEKQHERVIWRFSTRKNILWWWWYNNHRVVSYILIYAHDFDSKFQLLIDIFQLISVCVCAILEIDLLEARIFGQSDSQSISQLVELTQSNLCIIRLNWIRNPFETKWVCETKSM